MFPPVGRTPLARISGNPLRPIQNPTDSVRPQYGLLNAFFPARKNHGRGCPLRFDGTRTAPPNERCGDTKPGLSRPFLIVSVVFVGRWIPYLFIQAAKVSFVFCESLGRLARQRDVTFLFYGPKRRLNSSDGSQEADSLPQDTAVFQWRRMDARSQGGEILCTRDRCRASLCRQTVGECRPRPATGRGQDRTIFNTDAVRGRERPHFRKIDPVSLRAP